MSIFKDIDTLNNAEVAGRIEGGVLATCRVTGGTDDVFDQLCKALPEPQTSISVAFNTSAPNENTPSHEAGLNLG